MHQIDQKQLPFDTEIRGELGSFFPHSCIIYIFHNECILFYNQSNISI